MPTVIDARQPNRLPSGVYVCQSPGGGWRSVMTTNLQTTAINSSKENAVLSLKGNSHYPTGEAGTVFQLPLSNLWKSTSLVSFLSQQWEQQGKRLCFFSPKIFNLLSICSVNLSLYFLTLLFFPLSLISLQSFLISFCPLPFPDHWKWGEGRLSGIFIHSLH